MATSWMIFALVVVLTTSTSYGEDICNPPSTIPGVITSPGYPSPYENTPGTWNCSIVLEAPQDRLRLKFTDFDLREGDDYVMVVDDHGTQTMLTGSSLPKDFIGSGFEVTFISDGVENNATGFRFSYDEYTREPISRKYIMDDIYLKPGKALNLYTNDYPMLYDDDTYYIWNITSSSTGVMVMTIVDMDTEDQRDWLKVTSYSMTSGPEVLLYESGTPTNDVGQLTVRDADYVTVEFMTDYSRSGRGFHLIVEPDSAMDIISDDGPDTGCGGDLNLGNEDLSIHLPEETSNLHCIWRIENSFKERISIEVHGLFVEEGTEYLEIRSGLNHSDWRSYRRRLTGVVASETVFIDADESVTLIFSSGNADLNRTFHAHVGQMQDYGCSGEIDLSFNGRGYLDIGNFSDLSHVYCQWLIKTPLLTNINFYVDSLHIEHNYDVFEIGTGMDPTDIRSRQKLITRDVMDQTFSTYSGEMWVVFSAEDLMPGDDIKISVSLDDNACILKTILESYGEIDSPRGLNGMYPDDADCQWIVQVRGGFQVRLHFLEFDLEYGHDQLLIGGTNPDEDDVDSSYLILTGSEVPDDVVSRFNGLNLRFKTDSAMSSSGFKLIFQEFFDCPEGYEYDPANETCYKFVKTPASWLDARYDCNDVADGDLVVIGDSDENDYVLEKIRSMQESNETENWWIGFYDLAINGEWVWVDCEESTFYGDSNWQTGAPNNTDDHHCAYISTEDGEYNDDMCSNNRSYVCEITRKNYVDSDCYPSNFRVEEVSYTKADLRFTVSDYLCDVSGYKIRYNTSVPGEYVEEELLGARTNSIVINGLNTSTTYHFELTTCTVSYGCYSYRTALSVLASTADCPTGYDYFLGESCYSIMPASLSWVEARDQCISGVAEDADLVNIETMEENEYLGSMLPASGDYWIGLYDVVEEGEFLWTYECVRPPYRNWDGGDHPKDPNENCVTMNTTGLWNDANCSSPVGYICEATARSLGSDPEDVTPRFFRGTPINETTVDLTWTPPAQFCDITGYKISVFKSGETTPLAEIDVEGGETSELRVDGLSKGMFYTFRLETLSFSFTGVVPLETSAQTTGCPRLYEGSENGFCYRYSSDELTWTEATFECRRQLGADLVTIVDENELAFLQTFSDDDGWIGMSDSETEGDFTWSTCLDWSRETWNTPAGNTDDKDCVYLDIDTGDLMAENCSAQYAFLCKYDEDLANDIYPTDFEAEVLSFSEVSLTWTLPANLCSVTGYRIQYSTNIIRGEVQVDGAQSDSVVVMNLEEDTRYFFTISPIVPGSAYPQSNPINATTPLAPPCPSDYVLGFAGNCFKVSIDFASWTDARADCLQTENSDLVEITNETMTAYLQGQTGNGQYWIGLYDAVNEGDWRWGSECTAPSYTEWGLGEPGNDDVDYDCASFDGVTGTWSDQVCSNTLLYICEIKDRDSSPDSVSPLLLRGNSQTPSSITATWFPSSQQCDILAYILGWQGQNGDTGTLTVPGGDTSSAIINDLTPATDYVIFIDTLTFSFGNLGNSAGVEVSTLEDCPANYELGPTGDCYRFVPGVVEFHDAREVCQQTNGGDLVVIETPFELEYILNTTRGGDWWVGLYDVGTENNHRWVDCTEMNIWQVSNWAPGQPDDSDGTQDCGQMISSGEWMDWPCDRPNMYICELDPRNLEPRDLSPTEFLASPLSIVSILLSWVPSDFSCDVTGYRILISQGLLATTVDIDGGETSSYLVNNLLIDTEYGFRIAALTINGPLAYSERIDARTNNETVGCPADYEEGYQGGCYRFVKGSLTWSQARLECSKDFGGELVVVDNQEEYDYILNKTVEGDWWIGLQDQWSEGDFRWTDCSSMTAWQMTNWAPDEPDEAEGDVQDCVQMISSGQWMDWPCQRPNQFICEIFAKDYVPIQTAPSNFSGEAISDSTILLTWVPSEFNCDVIGYMIEYTDLNNAEEFMVVGGASDSSVVSGLRASTAYRFSIKPMLLIDRNLDYGLPIEATTLPYAGCLEPVVITDAPGNISSPNFPSNYPPSVDCVYTISLDTRIQLSFQLLFLLPDPEDYLTISEMGENGYEERVRLSGIFLPKSYISEATSIQIRFVTDNRIEGFGFFFTYTRYNVELPAEKQCTNVYPLKMGPVPLLFNSPGYPNGYEDNQDCAYVFQQSSTALGDVKVAADNFIELNFTDFSLENNYDVLIVGYGMDPSDGATEIDRYSGTNKPPFLRSSEDALWVKLETDSSNAAAAQGFSLTADEKTPSEIPGTKQPAPTESPVTNLTCGGTLIVPVAGFQRVQSPNYPQGYPTNLDCVWYLQADQGGRFRIGMDTNAFFTEYGYDVVEIGRGNDASDPTSHYVSLSGSVVPFSLMIEESIGWVRFTSDYSTVDIGFSLDAKQDRDCEETIIISPLTRTIRSPNYPLPYDINRYCLWSIVSSSGAPIRAVVNDFKTEGQYDILDVGTGRGDSAVSLDTRVSQLSGHVNESFTTNSILMWLAFTTDGSNNFGGFEITFFDDMCSNEIITDDSGTIQSPGYGFQYPNYASCNWAIQVEEGYNIRLSFQGFDLETGRDTLSIVGSRANPVGSLVLTGSEVPEDVISSINSLIIQFTADSSVVGRGFSFTYEKFFDCPEGYVEADVNGPTCYKFVDRTSTWLQAREDCRSTPGADLIMINNALENRYIRDVSGGEEWWIGYYDGGQEGVFSYVECDTSTSGWAIYNWADDQPSRIPGNEEDCVYILGTDGYYYDDECDFAKRYICETIPVPDIIPDAFDPSNLKTEALSPDTIRVSWTPSSYRCDVTGYTISYSPVGIGGNELTEVIEGSTTSFYDLSSLSPNTGYVITLRTTTFSFEDLPALPPMMQTTLPEGTTNCPTGYQQGPDYTCWRFAVNPSTWFDARLSCQSDDPEADLAVIDTLEELDFVNNTRLPLSYWIGFNDLGTERLFRWMDCQAPDTWQTLNWAPGAPSDLLGNNDCVELNEAGQWDDITCDTTRPFICKVQAKGFTEEDMYPSQFTVQATSALTASATWLPSLSSCNLLGYYLIASDGGINDDIITDIVGAISVQGEITGLLPSTFYVISIVPYSAQRTLESRYETLIETFDESTICPDGFELGYNFGCYRFVTEPKDWDAARMDCMNTTNGDLAVVDTQDEMDFFIEKGFGGFDWWVGLYDRADEGSYRWVDCSDLSGWGQSQWDAGQPSDIDGSENCGQLQDNAKFNDRACERALPYVCEIMVKDFDDEDVDPILFMSMSVTENSLLLQWLPSDYNCDIVGYTITYTNDGPQIVDVPGGDSNSQLIMDLMPETTYTFTLRANTYMGPRDTTQTTTVTTLPPANPCPEGWFVGYEDHCYKVAKSLVTWDEARQDCMSVEDGDLVVIETETENQYLWNETLGNDYWIGYYDRAREGQWSWVDCGADTEFAYSNWAPGQPNDLNGVQDCGQVTNFGEYNDWECDRTMMYICEIWAKSYLPSQANPSLFRGEAINPNTVTLSWTPSVRYSCDVVAYRITYEDPRDTIPTSVDVPGADASSVTLGDLQDGVMYNFSISSVLASGPVLAAQETMVMTPSLDDLCEPGWFPGYNYVCYKVVLDLVTWDEARADCQSIQDGDLVIIETEEELNYIRENVNEGDYWIGFYDKGSEGDWKWVDCAVPSVWARTNWAVGQPNDLSGTQDCGQMTNAGTWNDWECERTGQYICEVTPKDWGIIDQNPSRLRGEAIDPHTIQLEWRTSGTNCEVTGYRIYVVIEPDNEAYSVDVVGGETDSFLMKNLMANTVYTFDIAAITTIRILPTVGTVVRVSTPASGDCGITEFLEESGFVISPNYPNAYPDNQDCVYTIMLPDPTKMVEIKVENLDLEQGQDFLLIGSGATVDEGILATLSGDTIPEETLITDSNYAWMRFMSDESISASGFSISYESKTVEKDGEMIGSVTILLVDETAETLTPEDQDMFTSSVAEQLNVYCMASQENCLADMNGNQFTADNVIITSVVEVSEGVEVTFWVSDPNDPTGNAAALTSEQLENFLIENEAPIEEGGPNFDYIMRPKVTNAIEEPWVIAVICLLCFCFFILCVVLVRDCFKKTDEKTPSVDSLQMMPNVTATVDSENNEKRDSTYNENVYFQSGERIVEDEKDIKKSAPPSVTPQTNGQAYEVATTSFSTTPTSTDPTYAAPQKKASTKSVGADVEAGVEASEDEE
nr:uncharacterized protein LOC129257911 [Lytechinus pictus]